jgi:hypothetical protein
MPYDMSQIDHTAARVQQHPETTRRELLSLLCEKATVAARDLLGTVAANIDFERLRTAKYAEARGLHQAIEWHNDSLGRLNAAASRVRYRVEEVRDRIGDDETLLIDLVEAQSLADAACALVKTLRFAWERERLRLLRVEELRSLRFGTCLDALRPLLADVAEAGAPAPVANCAPAA